MVNSMVDELPSGVNPKDEGLLVDVTRPPGVRTKIAGLVASPSN